MLFVDTITKRECTMQDGIGSSVKPCGVSGRIRRDNRASRNKNAPHHSSLLLFVNGCSAGRLAFGVGAFGRSCHGLAVVRYDRPTRRMVLPASLPHFNGEGIGIYLFHGDGIPRCSSGRVLLAIVFVSAAVIDGSTVLYLPGSSDLHSTVNGLIHYGETRDWVCRWWRGLGFFDIPLPGSY